MQRVLDAPVRAGGVGEREKRPKVILAILGSVLVGVVLMLVLGAPRELLELMAAMAAGLVVTLAITLICKVSMHAAVAAGTAVILALVFGPVLNILWAVVALIGWSRVALRDHTLHQVVGGTTVGGLIALVAFQLLR